MQRWGKLFQVIEQRRFTRLGGCETIEVDVRIVAATNAPIEKMVAEGQFRADVFYRLNEYTIEIPPLHQRNEDIPMLVEHFLDLYGSKYENPGMEISPLTMSTIMQHKWPGNVRELESAIRRVALEGNENSIREYLLPSGCRRLSHGTVAETVRTAETQAILNALNETRWNQRKAAQVLEMSYSSLRRRISKYGLRN